MTQRVLEKFYSVGDVAALLGFKRAWVMGRVARGDFGPCVDLDGDMRIPASGVNAYLERNQVNRATPVSRPRARTGRFESKRLDKPPAN